MAFSKEFTLARIFSYFGHLFREYCTCSLIFVKLKMYFLISGQVTISFQLVAAKVLVPKDSDDDKSPRAQDINNILTPFKFKHSYENMTLITENEEGPKGRKILEYSYEEDDEEKKSWCSCFPFFCCGSKSRKKKAKEKHKDDVVNNSKNLQQNGADVSKSEISLNFCDIMVSLPSQPSSPIKSGSTFFKSRPPSPKKSDSQTFSQKSNSLDRNSNHQLSEILSVDLSDGPDVDKQDVEVKYDPKSEDVTVELSKPSEKSKKSKKAGKKKGKTSLVEVNNQKNEINNTNSVPPLENKENSDPVIFDVETGADNETKQNGHSISPPKQKKKKATPPTSLGSKTTSAMKRSETYELVERWKSEGQKYERARDQFFQYCDNTIQSKIVRYFEQKRSTLVLQIGVEKGLSVSTICMTIKQVRKLLEDYEMGILHEDLVQCILPQNIVDKMDCCAIHLRTVIDVDDFTMSFQELC